MIADLDIYRAAKLEIDQYGAGASIQAAMRAEALLDQGDIEGSAISPYPPAIQLLQHVLPVTR
jgi:hypothetical protein